MPSNPPADKSTAKKAGAAQAATKKAVAKKAAAATPAKKTAGNTAARTSDPTAIGGGRLEATSPDWAQAGDVVTTPTGTPVDDTDNSLRAGSRGPTLMEDHHLREKIMHFDHERIPERVVHARGAGAHGTFQVIDPLDDLTSAPFLSDASRTTPVFVRFSTVAGSRGSADTARDVRGFAVKFYTEEGNFDLVGNNMPVFFIQDGIKFPDLIHAAKPEPDREIPQAQTAHDTFWDFASLQPETTHMLMWIMSDRAIPRSFRTMEGFGVHTFRLVHDDGSTALVKFHWKPVLGLHSLVWEESQRLGGIDPDFHRRDLWNAIEAGAYPEWELGVQVMPDTPDQTFEGIDLLDSTKLVPEELCPVRIVGRMKLDSNPASYFAETEQVAFHTGHLVRGIDITDDPLLHARMFSYTDTQLTRLGGPNFEQLPINRPHAPVNNGEREGFGQQAVHQGRASYTPNTIDGGCPFSAGAAGYVHVPQPVEGVKERKRAVSFGDHYSQATMFWTSMTPPEQDHIVGAFAFELSKVSDEDIQDRTLANLANVDNELCARVAAHIGRPVPAASAHVELDGAPLDPSPALSMAPVAPGRIDGRIIGLIVGDGVDATAVGSLAQAVTGAGAVLQVIGPRGGTIGGQEVHKTLHSCDSVEFDALILDPSSLAALADDRKVAVMAQEAYRHHKPLAAIGSGADVLVEAGIDASAPGVLTRESSTDGFADDLIEAVGWHRYWDRMV